MFRKLFRYSGFIFIVAVLGLLLCELLVRMIFHDHFRVIGDKIILPANQVYETSRVISPKLDDHIIHHKNSLGFRGEEMSALENTTRIIAVGGSSTECFYLNDGRDWPTLLGKQLKDNGYKIWINNAGLSGHSTFGHIQLLEDHIIDLKPDMILFYFGFNDLNRSQANSFDELLLLDKIGGVKRVVYRSRLFSVVKNLYTSRELSNSFVNATTRPVDFMNADSLWLPPDDVKFQLDSNAMAGYRERISQLIHICKSNSIRPVFLTQASLYSCDYDVDSLVHLGTIKLYKTGYNACTASKAIDAYNSVLREVAANNNCPTIEMDERMPKDLNYYYDFIHFTNEGSARFSKELFGELKEFISSN